MRTFALLAFAAALTATVKAEAPQVAVSVGVAPDCPHGYYDVAPYNCAPYGYYGPEWFNDGVFIGVGPWFHGDEHFRGHVDTHFHPEHGYKGPMPNRGEHADRHIDASHFKGNQMRDGKGRVVKK